MPKPRKKIKQLEVSAEPDKRKRESAKEDFAGNFLVGIFTAIITALISQAVSNQINWLIVVFVAGFAFIVLAIYQKRR